MKLKLTFLLTVFCATLLHGQPAEVVVPMTNNPAIKLALMQGNARSNQLKSAQQVNDTLTLPFFDDFSIFTVWPEAARWTDSSVFVSPGFAINPLTVGAATFDGLDKEGNPYDNVSGGASGICDVLTSQPIDLFKDENGLPYAVSDSICLVFYYQRKGNGDAPETNDSLRLEFFNVTNQQWDWIWSQNGVFGGDTVFNKVKISINNPDYRQSGFRFRISNYGSKNGNLDIWNVDYITLNKFLPPNYEEIRDFAWVYPPKSLLNTFSAVPWKHFSALAAAQQQSMVQTTAALTVRNNYEPNPFPVKIAGISTDQYGAVTAIVGGGGLNSIQIPLNTNVTPPANLLTNSFFTDPSTDEQVQFQIKYAIGQTSGGFVDDYPINDTAYYTQDFYNYYSYDDGSAELGYGLNVANGKMAYKFEILQPDTLRAIKIFFTQLGTSVSNQLFTLAVWSGGATPTGSPLYQKFNAVPSYTDSINGFYTYLTDPLYLTAGTYFFGLIQNSNKLLNVGLDINTPADQSRKLINTSGAWTNSQLPGMWMIRPVFSSTPIDVGVHDPVTGIPFSIAPVPATTAISLLLPEIIRPGELYYNIYDLTGKLLQKGVVTTGPVSIEKLQEGMYLLEVSDIKTGQRTTRRFIKTGNQQ